jgi:hypothetical protein
MPASATILVQRAMSFATRSLKPSGVLDRGRLPSSLGFSTGLRVIRHGHRLGIEKLHHIAGHARRPGEAEVEVTS